MKKTTKTLISVLSVVLVMCLIIPLKTSGQDTRFTQAYNAPLRLNPALMGPNTNLKGILNYRSQWGTIDKGYTTYRFTFLYPLIIEDAGKLDIGLSAINDQAGAFNTMNISIALGYSVKVGDAHALSAAIIGGFGQQALDMTDETFDEQYQLGSYSAANPLTETIPNESRSYPDFGAGLLWNMEPDDAKINAFAGVAVYHHNKPDASFRGEDYNVPVLSNFHGGVKIIGDKFDFTPNLLLSGHGGAEEGAFGLNTDYKFNETMKITVGIWYRYLNQNSLAGMLAFEHQNFGLAYSYDMASFKMNEAIPSTMTHEMTLFFQFDRDKGTASAPMSE